MKHPNGYKDAIDKGCAVCGRRWEFFSGTARAAMWDVCGTRCKKRQDPGVIDADIATPLIPKREA